MKILITAGSTQMPIDRVRIISNIFKGATGFRIANEAAKKGHDVVLICNGHHLAETNEDNYSRFIRSEKQIVCHAYKTFDELEALMKAEITSGNYDVIIHSSAVSDYKVSVVTKDVKLLERFAEHPEEFTTAPEERQKISSGQILYMALTPTIKLVDQIRSRWGFKGKLVKFKLQVNVSDDELIAIAKKSRAFSKADYIVANSLEYFNDWNAFKMFIVNYQDEVIPCPRQELAARLLEMLEV